MNRKMRRAKAAQDRKMVREALKPFKDFVKETEPSLRPGERYFVAMALLQDSLTQYMEASVEAAREEINE